MSLKVMGTLTYLSKNEEKGHAVSKRKRGNVGTVTPYIGFGCKDGLGTKFLSLATHS